jgi:hypothetical protein
MTIKDSELTAADQRVAAALQHARRAVEEAAVLDKRAREAGALADPEHSRFVVAEGMTFPTRTGLLGAFQEVRLQDIEGGICELEQLVTGGVITVRPL